MKTEILKYIGFMQPFHLTEYENACKKTAITRNNKDIGCVSKSGVLLWIDPETIVFVPDKIRK